MGGGFCLWDTKYSNYSVMHSPYGKDVVAQFVASCKKYGIKPCYYMGPNANGYLSNKQSYSAEAFVDAQLGMLRELLTKYDCVWCRSQETFAACHNFSKGGERE